MTEKLTWHTCAAGYVASAGWAVVARINVVGIFPVERILHVEYKDWQANPPGPTGFKGTVDEVKALIEQDWRHGRTPPTPEKPQPSQPPQVTWTPLTGPFKGYKATVGDGIYVGSMSRSSVGSHCWILRLTVGDQFDSYGTTRQAQEFFEEAWGKWWTAAQAIPEKKPKPKKATK